MGSNKAYLSPTEAEANKPIDPPITLASSLIMSPNIFSVRITSNCFGFNIICIAALSTNKKSRATSEYSFATSPTTLRHNLELSNTLALSTKVTFLLLFKAALKAK